MEIIRISKPQLEAIKDLVDDCYAMLGGGDDEVDKLWDYRINLIDKMLSGNGLKPRKFKGKR